MDKTKFEELRQSVLKRSIAALEKAIKEKAVKKIGVAISKPLRKID